MGFSRSKMKDAGPSPKQVKAYGIAASMACRALGIFGAREEAEYRHKVVSEVARCESIKSVRSESDYEAVMARLWADAGDWQQASKYSVGDARRMAYVLKVLAIQLMQLKSADECLAMPYIGGVLDRAGIRNTIGQSGCSFGLDIGRPDTMLAMRILDTERRRILKRLGSDKTAFSDRIVYKVDGEILTRISVGPCHYENQPFNVSSK